MLKSYMNKLYLSRILNKPLVKPRSVTITLTSCCNLKCIMCDHWKLKNQEEPSLEKVRDYIDQIKRWDIKEIDLSGGEPFIRRDIFDIIDYANRNRLKINITTNGTLLDKNLIKKLHNVDKLRLQISLDGNDANTHDKIRGTKGTFDRIVSNINQLKKNKNLQLNATTVIMDNNFHKLLGLHYFTKKLGFSSITYQPVNDSNLYIGKRKRYNPLRIQKNHLKEFDEIINKLIQIRKQDAFIGNSVSFLEAIKRFFHDETIKNIPCYSGFWLELKRS